MCGWPTHTPNPPCGWPAHTTNHPRPSKASDADHGDRGDRCEAVRSAVHPGRSSPRVWPQPGISGVKYSGVEIPGVSRTVLEQSQGMAASLTLPSQSVSSNPHRTVRICQKPVRDGWPSRPAAEVRDGAALHPHSNVFSLPLQGFLRPSSEANLPGF